MIFQKNNNFELEIWVKSRGGRSARCMGTPPVAEMLASEARHESARGGVRGRQPRVRRPLSMPFPGRSIERVMRACQQLPQISLFINLFRGLIS